MTWTPDRIDELTRLWNEGQSASAIGKQLGISKNAVVGKAHRLKLAARPSPIRKQEAGNATTQRKRSESLAMPPRSESSGEAAESASQPLAQPRPEESTPKQVSQPQSPAREKSQAPQSRETDKAGAEPENAAKSRAKAQPQAAKDRNPTAVDSAAPPPSEQALEAINARASRPKPAPRPQPVSRTPKPAESAAPSNRSCQWPIGDPSQPDFHFCESPAAPGRPYCAEHCAMAYITRSKDSSKNKSSEAA
ncbi:GcrA family cell cycle regulator [Fodinicurvata fenggangensis]|uniref:GcrA family cell cycle regulator n=1 Tax=Fodinicurvata fenggangensis TaxID=1121830 RepID=UPI00054D8AD3|nr:GcrA family cell cycle regulator [Fodinicurvata fenggangensis]